MTGDLGALGFWLMLGMILAAGTVSRGLKERDKERERQATLRALLEKDSQSVTEVLAYLREKDAADRQLQRQLSGADWFDGFKKKRRRTGAMAVVAAIAVAVAGFVGGLIAGTVMSEQTESRLVPLGMMVAFWVAGGVIAWLIVRSSRKKENDSPVA